MLIAGLLKIVTGDAAITHANLPELLHLDMKRLRKMQTNVREITRCSFIFMYFLRDPNYRESSKDLKEYLIKKPSASIDEVSEHFGKPGLKIACKEYDNKKDAVNILM